MRSRSSRVGLIAGLLLLWSLPAHAATQPNIILVALDDLGACSIGKYKTDRAECIEAYLTPVIDGLAASGVTVKTAWAQPSCSPWRSSVMTGTQPQEHRVGGAFDIELAQGKLGLSAARPNLARTLEAGGYDTYVYGKWHMAEFELGDGQVIHPSSLGFTTGRGSVSNLAKTTESGVGGVGYTDWQLCDFMTGSCSGTAETTYATTFTIDDAITVLDNAEPWFLYLPVNVPHNPQEQPPIEIPPLYQPHSSCDGEAEDLDHICFLLAVNALDTELGRVIDHANYDPTDTVIIITSDNGPPPDIAQALQPLWEDGRCKNSVGECGLWVPMIVSGAGVGTGTADILVSATDLHATILDIAGVENPGAGYSTGSMLPSLGGRQLMYRSVSFWPNLQDPTLASKRSCIYAEEFADFTGVRTNWNEAMRTADYKLIRHRTAGTEELFLTSSIREDAVTDVIATPYGGADLIAYNDLTAKMDLMNVAGGDPCR
jgi:arylsulfatase A-like enzyme